jgi:anti-sigma regulatory factor (Ser/Thr protein kinase)
VRADAVVDRLRVTIADTGSWRPKRQVPDIGRGRGTNLMRGLMEDVTVASDDGGTTVDMYKGIV